MNFEERLLAELRTEVAGRAARQGSVRRPRWRPGWRRLTGGALAGGAAAAAILAPTFVGPEAAAYAVTRNADGSVTVTIMAMRHADRLERDLAQNGARTDITYLPQHMRCVSGRGAEIGVQPPLPPGRSPHRVRAATPAKEYAPNPLRWASSNRPNVFKIFPQRIGAGRTLVLELGESHRTRLWKLGSYVVAGPVKPCRFENDPYWN